jgi:hypothetical protein
MNQSSSTEYKNLFKGVCQIYEATRAADRKTDTTRALIENGHARDLSMRAD